MSAFRYQGVPIFNWHGVVLTALIAVSLAAPVLGAKAPAAKPAPEKAPVAIQAAPATPPNAPASSDLPVSEEFHYNGAGRRDPFKSLLILQEKKKDVSMLPPIQQVDLSTFKVVGIIMDNISGNRAMVRAPDSKTYVVKKGDIIGKNEGEVVSIDFQGITVKEKFLDFMNKETATTTVLKVTDKQK